MTTEELILHHATLVAGIKDDVERAQRVRNASPLMLALIKAMRSTAHEQPVGAWWGAIDAVLGTIEENEE